MSEKEVAGSALKRAMAICASREMCFSDIDTLLERWGISETERRRILSRLSMEKFIDEERYARAFTLDKFRHNRWGKVKISTALKYKRIPSDIISQALDSIDTEEYYAALKSLINSHRRLVKGKNEYEIKGKLLRFGLSKGFENNLLYELLNDPDFSH